MAGKRSTRHDPTSHLNEARSRWGGTSYKNAPTKSVSVDGTKFVYRELGIDTGVPVIFLNHLAANLDNWDPRVVDGIAAKHRVITFDNRGLGASEGKTPDTVEAMAHDAVAFIRALGFARVDLLGFSLGGMVAQVIAAQEPALVRKVILAGTGPAGGEGIVNVTKLSYLDTLHAYATFKDPKELLFFTRTAHGKSEAKAFIKRLKERTTDRDKATSIRAFRTQLKAIHAFGLQKPADLSRVQQPVLVANGDDDRMVPTSNSYDLAHRLPNATLRIYPDAGHGGIFQAHERFVPEALEFLEA
ncbi:putative hydrolase or acyltransferase of alpha/beta superfamily [Mycobacterium sp. JS623]|uniref:alpha/beta fold hydrolase n=1 Tax=Mycobacterium sp. JS623 TaxID=212767 RepID=UPI0002A55CAF|nr:alpha/beta hydrolase [Mycobacterium sp. JS623]AGB21634.1 putative hydrolase or acyltransferase of alpha/beta superfamily [Mycobacterium sp. JS623]